MVRKILFIIIQMVKEIQEDYRIYGNINIQFNEKLRVITIVKLQR
jgi:hypothetical protein